MKTSIKILFLLLFVLVLSACTNPFQKTETTQTQVKAYSCNDLKSGTFRTDCVNQLSVIAVDALNSEILGTFNAKRCVELPQEMADECVNRIQKSGVQGPITDEQVQALHEAMNLSYKTTQGAEGEVIPEDEGYYDIAKCATLTAKGLKEYCEKNINIRIEEEKMFKIVGTGDITKCDELTNEESKKSCKVELGVIEEPENVDETEPVPMP
jgi:hypothetical protein